MQDCRTAKLGVAVNAPSYTTRNDIFLPKSLPSRIVPWVFAFTDEEDVEVPKKDKLCE